MTDFQKLKDLLDGWEVGYKLETSDGKQVITLEVGEDKIDGYCCFFTDAEFDNEGKFTQFNILE